MIGVARGASGFVTAHSSLGADLSLLASVAVAVLLTVGVVLARRQRYDAHRWVQSSAVAINVVVVVAWMITSLVRYILPGLPGTLSEPGHLLAVVHAGVGAVALVLGLLLVVRGNQLMAQRSSLRGYRTAMRLGYVLYMVALALGIALYVVTYA